MPNHYQIAEFLRLTGAKRYTVHTWVRRGILKPQRTPDGYRYTQQDVDIALSRIARSEPVSFEVTVRRAVDLLPAEDRRALLDEEGLEAV